MHLNGKIAIVTGGSRGIGLGIAQAYARKGARIVLVGRSRKTLEIARETLHGDQHDFHELDVSDASKWKGLSDAVETPDILVNAAGITHYSLLSRTSVTTVEEVIATNLLGTVYGSRTFYNAMLRRKSGLILNISSALSFRGGAGSSVYAASKAGINAFTRTLSEELGPRGIRVVGIAPGYVDTAMVKGMSTTMRESIIARTGVRRMGSVEEIATSAVFIAENEYINGTTISVDGGFSSE